MTGPRKAKVARPNALTPALTQLQLLVDEREAARILHLKPEYLLQDRRGRRLIPFLKIGDLVRYVPEELYELVNRWREARDRALREGRLPEVGPYEPLPEPESPGPTRRKARATDSTTPA